MQIIQITEKQIFAYHDYSFFVFGRTALTLNSREVTARVGDAWHAGKAEDPSFVEPTTVKAGSLYHNQLISTLIQIAEDANHGKS